MAVGNSGLNLIDDDIFVISNNLQDMRVSWNTFQYVAKNLNVWADETTIGSESKIELTKLSDELDRVLNNTSNLIDTIENFVTEQRKTNGS